MTSQRPSRADEKCNGRSRRNLTTERRRFADLCRLRTLVAVEPLAAKPAMREPVLRIRERHELTRRIEVLRTREVEAARPPFDAQLVDHALEPIRHVAEPERQLAAEQRLRAAGEIDHPDHRPV